jgi:ParB family chromosome partitioning protein
MRSALGKGLSALISDETVASVEAVAASAAPAQTPNVLPIASIRANPNQPRKVFSEESMNELATSIKEHGVLQPILVTPVEGDTFEIIAGERRWRAAQRAGLTDIPAIVKTGTETEKFQMALIENIQRADLNPIELAKGYKRLQDEFAMTQETIAQSVGKDRAVVANTLRLLNLASEIQQAVEEGALSAAHARTLAGLEDANAQLALFKQILTDQLTVRAVEQAVRSQKQVKVREHTRAGGFESKTPEVRAIEEELQQSLARKVELRETDASSHKGWLKLEFYSLDDLDALIARLKKSA